MRQRREQTREPRDGAWACRSTRSRFSQISMVFVVSVRQVIGYQHDVPHGGHFVDGAEPGLSRELRAQTLDDRDASHPEIVSAKNSLQLGYAAPNDWSWPRSDHRFTRRAPPRSGDSLKLGVLAVRSMGGRSTASATTGGDHRAYFHECRSG